MAISYGKPENREFHFQRPHLDFELKTYALFPEGCSEQEKEEKSHYVYLCKKGEGSKDALSFWDEVKEVLIKQAEEEEARSNSSKEEEQKDTETECKEKAAEGQA